MVVARCNIPGEGGGVGGRGDVNKLLWFAAA